jgi:hypothetical protein
MDVAPPGLLVEAVGGANKRMNIANWTTSLGTAESGVTVFDLYAVAVLLFRTKRLRLDRIPLQVQRILRVIAVGLVVGNWIYLLCYLR